MTVKELKEMLNQFPDNAIVYVAEDHGQLPEQAHTMLYTDEKDLQYYGDEHEWFDIDAIAITGEITAISIEY
jgi:hypothetical protein